MITFIPYILKGLWGHRARTMLTVSGTAVALFVFCFVTAVQQGLYQLTESEDAQRTLVVFQENRFCPQSSKLPEDYARWLSNHKDVADVVPIKVFTNNCRASLDSIVFQGLPADKLKGTRDISLVAGDWNGFEQREDAALVGRDVAARRGVIVGEKFSIGGVTVTIAGIFHATVPAENNLIYTHLDFLQRARGKNDVGTVTQLELRLAEHADAEVVAAEIDKHFRGGPVATATRTKGMFQTDTLSDLAELIGCIHWLGYACIGLVLALVAATTVMSVHDRTKEHGVLQTVGLRPLRVFQLVILESTLLSTVGGMLGIGVGVAYLALSGLSVAAEGVTIAFQPTLELIVVGMVVSTAVGLLAGIAPGLQAARTPIIDALRHTG
jgi:putative ABC transport system permease protein